MLRRIMPRPERLPSHAAALVSGRCNVLLLKYLRIDKNRRAALGLLPSALALLWLLLATCASGATNAPGAKVPCDLTAEDHAVYAAVLKDPDVWHLPINAATPGPFTLDQRKDEWKQGHGPLSSTADPLLQQASSETHDDFAAKSTKSCYVGAFRQKDLERPSGIEYRADERPPKESYWYGRIDLSRVGFNSAKTEALVYTESSCGVRCGGGDFFLLRKKDGAWVVVAQINLWEL
jgi:hypothetical protein